MQQYLDKALAVLKKFDLLAEDEAASELTELLQEVVHVDEPKVLAIARTIKYMSSFNELVRSKVEDIRVGHRYSEIAELFNSIRDDSKTMVAQLDDGKIDLGEKVQNVWMKLSRGTPHDRFEKISELYNEVCEDTREQLRIENEVLDAYIDFRFAVKEAEVLSQELLITQTEVVEGARTQFEEASAAVDAAGGDDSAAKSKLQLARDEALETFNKKDRSYQLIKDVTENLSIAYNVGETLITKLKQTHDVKDQVYRKAVTFFTTNEHVFTILDTVYTSQHGLHEATQTTEALKEGVNKGLEDVADLGRELERAALKAGYGSTVNPQSVKKLVDAIVDYQTESRKMIEELREQSAADTKEIERIVEDGKKRFKEAVVRHSVSG